MFRDIKTIFASATLISLAALIIYDSLPHFDAELVKLKRQHDSPQRNWNLFYSQDNVFQNSSIRYATELGAIANLIKTGSIVLSDRASSYYIAAESRAFVKNIHAHHGLNRDPMWRILLGRQNACFPDNSDRLRLFTEFVNKQKADADRLNRPPLNYILVNHDKQNRNLRLDCLAARSGSLNKEYSKLLPRVYRGEYFTLYSLKGFN